MFLAWVNCRGEAVLYCGYGSTRILGVCPVFVLSEPVLPGRLIEFVAMS